MLVVLHNVKRKYLYLQRQLLFMCWRSFYTCFARLQAY